MLLTLQYSIVSAPIKDYTDWKRNEESEDWEENPYFSTGHGDFSEEHGFSPKFVVWAIIGGLLEVSELIDPESEGHGVARDSSHGFLWGHHVTDQGYKGRYEPETGRLSIVKPERFRHRDIPKIIMEKLESRFKNITEISLF